MKKILFITGTRADFGKLKPLIRAVDASEDFECHIFCTGMHLMEKYGNTVSEVRKAGFTQNLYPFLNQVEGESMEIIMSNTIAGLSRYLHENVMDLIVVHGDRIEALAGATVGALRNVLVAHIEGGEVSGTIDDLIRHACSKMSHVHFVASETARRRLIQLGESESTVFQIGSPDIDIMLSNELPSITEVRERYGIDFDNFAIAMLHPVTTEAHLMEENAKEYVQALLESDRNYVVVYPNNDLGSEHIFNAYQSIRNHPRFKVFPSLRFEYFLSLLKYSEFLIGNSSAGIHEAPVYGVPTINIGSRQNNRFQYVSISNVLFKKAAILDAIAVAVQQERYKPTDHYGDGQSAQLFMEAIQSDGFWTTNCQKTFVDIG